MLGNSGDKGGFFNFSAFSLGGLGTSFNNGIKTIVNSPVFPIVSWSVNKIRYIPGVNKKPAFRALQYTVNGIS